MERMLNKFNGWPSMVLGTAVIVGVAYGAFHAYGGLEREKALILAELEKSRDTEYSLLREIDMRQEIIDNFQDQIGDIASTVGTLEKLSQTDEELLRKYSKIYFLNENYSPSKLTDIDKIYLSTGATNTMIHSQVWPHLERLLEEAHEDGVKLLVASAFRSFQTQSSLKANYKVIYGSGANAFSADQGYSEHQLGTALDFTSQALGANFNPFATDPAYKWLQENAHDYGFVLSYPPNNAYYKFEPWHWRYVGVDLATDLHEEGKYFYDLDQRQIDSYLVKLFD